MGIFRSETMIHKKIRLPKDTAVEIINELGKLDECIEFIDLNKDDLEAKKNFLSMIKRCDEMEKKLNNFEKICEQHSEKIYKYASFRQFISDLEKDEKLRDRKYGATYFDLLESEISEEEKKITELIESYNHINENLENLIEKKSVFDKSSQLFLSESESNNSYGSNRIINNPQGGDLEDGFRSDLNFIAGVIKAEDDLRMKRMIFRISRGRAIPTFFDLSVENKISKEKIQKKIFTIFFQGGIEGVLFTKLLKICDAFGASRFNVPRRNVMQIEINKLQNEINEKMNYLKQAKNSIKDFIRDKVGNENYAAKYELYRLYFKKEKYIYTNLNKCISRGNFIDGEVWIPEDHYDQVLAAVRNVSFANENKLTANFFDAEESTLAPPTFFKKSDFNDAFQEIVNTYGIPRYKEINPALFNIVTFPFLFGVMFGDIGHGLILFLFGIYLVTQKDEIVRQNSALKAALPARYLLLFMGFFAFYSGWMYNDFLSIPLGIFGTCYEDEGDKAVRVSPDCVYPFGLDPKWYVASNELAFFNSMKMKISVIFGVTHMLFGIVLKGVNAVYFKMPMDLIFEFVPQIIFLSILFGYMNIMIFIKWSTDWSKDPSKAPSIISLLMKIFLDGGSVDGKPLFGEPGYQESLHFWILIIALICVPIMLFPKPIMLYLEQQKKHAPRSSQGFQHLVEEKDGIDHHHEGEHGHAESHGEHGFGEIFVHQSIETIEFVLGAISNTASYLRLWALSLAHAQLAKVFFHKSLLGGIQEGNVIKIAFGFLIFANVTFFVLMCMDLMECFLHTLRLHWVEFQNKFFKADGYKFSPYSFKVLVEID